MSPPGLSGVWVWRRAAALAIPTLTSSRCTAPHLTSPARTSSIRRQRCCPPPSCSNTSGGTTQRRSSTKRARHQPPPFVRRRKNACAICEKRTKIESGCLSLSFVAGLGDDQHVLAVHPHGATVRGCLVRGFAGAGFAP